MSRSKWMLAAVVGLVGVVGLLLTWRVRPGGDAETSEGAADERSGGQPRGAAAATRPLPRFAARPTADQEPPAQEALVGSEREKALELRKPVITAIRAAHQDPAAKAAAMVKAIETTGPSVETWTSEAGQVFRKWTDAMPPDLTGKLRLGEPKCFNAGCLVEVRFPDLATERVASAAMRSMVEPAQAHGGRVQTPPRAAAGGEAVTTTWIMLRPVPGGTPGDEG